MELDDKNEFNNGKNLTRKQKRIIEKKKKEEEKKDYESMLKYMKNLDEWDKKFIYKSQQQNNPPQANNNADNNEIKEENQDKNK